MDRDFDVGGIARIEGIRIERRQGTRRSGARRHRVRVLGKRSEKIFHVFMKQRVVPNRTVKVGKLVPRGQFTVDQQVGDFKEAAVLRKRFDGNTSKAQFAFLFIDEADRTHTRARVRITGVKGDGASNSAKLADIDADLAVSAHHDGQLNLLVADSKGGLVGIVGHVGHVGHLQ